MASTATPRLKTGALHHPPRRFFPPYLPAGLRPGGLIPNSLVSTSDGAPVRLDTILAGRTAVLTARRPSAHLAVFCRRHGLALVRISAPGTGIPAEAGADTDPGWTDVSLADGQSTGLRALAANPALTIIVRPDRVVAAAEPRGRLPLLPWHIPATAVRERPATALPPTDPDPAGPLPAAC
jgi:hypothetical protein